MISDPQVSATGHLKRQLYALTEVSKTLALPLELSDLLAAVMLKIAGVLDHADVGIVMLWDHSAGLFRAAASFGMDAQALKDFGLRAGESITGKVYDQGQALLLNAPSEVAKAMGDMRPANRVLFYRALGSSQLPRCVLAAPVTAGEQKYGVLMVETLTGEPFVERDVPFVQTVADLIALAIDRSRLEEQADAVRETRHYERMRSELMGTLSHELRILLSAIKGYSTALLLDEVEWSEEKRLDFIRQIDKASDEMEAMIKEILDASLIDVDRLTIEREPLRLPQVAQDVALEIQRRTPAHRILVDFAANFPIVEADLNWIKQVFRNILDNAVKYSPEGGLIVIRGEVRPSDVVVSVADQGIGISPEDLIPLFERYFRVRSASGLHVSGTGLGLPIARTIVEAHGGRIWAESKVGQGTILSFSLPRQKEKLVEETPVCQV